MTETPSVKKVTERLVLVTTEAKTFRQTHFPKQAYVHLSTEQEHEHR